MKRDSIITLPHKHLRQKSKRVGLITEEVRSLIADMESAVLDWEDSRQHEIGVALAAVQVDNLLRIVVIRNDFKDKQDRTFQALINPEITKLEGEQVEDFEGCLSVNGIYGKVPRFSRIRLKALDIDGRPIRLTAEGFLARVLQHEIDHIKGIVFVDHIKNNSDAFYILRDDGDLDRLDYNEDIKDSQILWTP